MYVYRRSRFWWKAYDQLLNEYECTQYRCMIPCFISNPQTKITDHPGIIEYRYTTICNDIS